MANGDDPINPPDNSNTINQATQLNDIYREQANRLKELKNAIDDKNNALSPERERQVRNEITQLNTAITENRNVYRRLTSELSTYDRTMLEVNNSQNAFKDNIKDLSSSLQNRLSGAFQSVTSAISKFAPIMGTVGTDIGRSLSNPLSGADAIVRTFTDNLGVGGTAIKNVNDSIKSLIQVQGVAREALVQTGDAGADTADIISQYPQVLRRMNVATGLSTDALNSMTKTLSFMGANVLTPVREGIEGLDQATTAGLTSPALLATTFRAFGVTAEASAGKARDAFINFNQTIPDTVRQLGDMADASRQTGVDLENTRNQIERASAPLAIFGQRTGSASGVWTTFINTLKNNVPLSQIGGMVESLTRGIASMNIQTRAFIGNLSGMTAGSTALGGGLKMELAMRSPGGLEKNLEALTQALSRVTGGEILTIEQAVNIPGLETQFELQRRLLGQFTSINDSEQQNRVLETLQNVQRGGISQIEGSKELGNVFNRGLEIQNKELTFLERIASNTALMVGRTDRQIQAINENAMPDMNALLELGTLSDIYKEEESNTAIEVSRQFGRGMANIPTAISQNAVPINMKAVGDNLDAFSSSLTDRVRNTLPARQRGQEAPDRPTHIVSLEQNKVEKMDQILLSINSLKPNRMEQIPTFDQGENETGRRNPTTTFTPPTESNHTITIRVEGATSTEDIQNDLLNKLNETLGNYTLGVR